MKIKQQSKSHLKMDSLNLRMELPVVEPAEEMLGKRTDTISHEHTESNNTRKVDTLVLKNFSAESS